MENRKDEIKRGIRGTGVDDTKGVKNPVSPSMGSAPVSGFNAQSGKELGSGSDYGTSNLNSPSFGANTHDGVTSRKGKPGGLRRTLRNWVGRFGRNESRSHSGESRI